VLWNWINCLPTLALGILFFASSWFNGGEVSYSTATTAAPADSSRSRPAAPAASFCEARSLLRSARSLCALQNQDATAMLVVMIAGVSLFAIIFAVNSSVHSYLVVRYADGNKVPRAPPQSAPALSKTACAPPPKEIAHSVRNQQVAQPAGDASCGPPPPAGSDGG